MTSQHMCIILENKIEGSLMDFYSDDEKFKILTAANKLEFVNQTVRALEFIHNKGRLHRDLKSTNVLLKLD